MAITLGFTVSNRAAAGNFSGNTTIWGPRTASATGKITSFSIYVQANITGLKMGVFSRNGNSFTCRSYTTIGNSNTGSNTHSGLNLDVVVGDYIGMYWENSTGRVENDSTGAPKYWYKAGDHFADGEQAYSQIDGDSDDFVSIAGAGVETSTGNFMAIL